MVIAFDCSKSTVEPVTKLPGTTLKKIQASVKDTGEGASGERWPSRRVGLRKTDNVGIQSTSAVTYTHLDRLIIQPMSDFPNISTRSHFDLWQRFDCIRIRAIKSLVK